MGERGRIMKFYDSLSYLSIVLVFGAVLSRNYLVQIEKKSITLDKSCLWGSWEQWSQFELKCRRLERSRRRSCMCGANIETAYKCGKGNTTETEHVESWNGEKCCYWKNWGEWSALEATCGSTTRTRIRDCLCGNEINSKDKCGNEKNTDFQLVKKEVCPIGPLVIPGAADYTLGPKDDDCKKHGAAFNTSLWNLCFA